jgi:hypothetical protein
MDGRLIVAIAGTVFSAIMALVGYKAGFQKKCKEEGEETGTLKANTEYIKRRIDDVLLEQKDTNKSINMLAERVTRVEESSKAAHRRIDGIERK